MLVSIDGTNQRPLFSPRRRRSSDCQCAVPAVRASVVALDPRSNEAPGNIYFADAETGESSFRLSVFCAWENSKRNGGLFSMLLVGNIWTADLYGCKCSLVANASHAEGLPPDYITVDSQRVYWSQQGREEVFSLLKEGSEIDSAKIAHGVRNIRALNQQKYPGEYPRRKSCLPQFFPSI